MKKLLSTLIIAVLFTACTEKETIIIQNEIIEVSLNSLVNLDAETGNIFSKKPASCEFPTKYEHNIPTEFNVYFLATNGAKSYEFNNVTEGKKTFKIEKNKYRIVVTNSTKHYRGELDVYSSELYLFGETEVDYTKTTEGYVEVTNDYASVMVVNNDAITSTPVLDGQQMDNVGVYYNLYTRKKGQSYLGINNDTKQVNQVFKANHVYRYILCNKGDLTIDLQDDILEETHDEEL